MGGNTTSLSWDAAGRLTGITYPSSATNSFTYNDLGQRTSKTDSAGTVNSLFDGTAVLADSRADYTHGGMTGLVSERASGTSKWYHGSQLGTTKGLTNSSQTVTDSREADAWGLPLASSGSAATPFGFVGGQGYQTDNDSGLMLLGARYYDSSVGRFISRDPLRFGGGDVDLYRYCGNDPVAKCDPSGLKYPDLIPTDEHILNQIQHPNGDRMPHSQVGIGVGVGGSVILPLAAVCFDVGIKTDLNTTAIYVDAGFTPWTGGISASLGPEIVFDGGNYQTGTSVSSAVIGAIGEGAGVSGSVGWDKNGWSGGGGVFGPSAGYGIAVARDSQWNGTLVLFRDNRPE